MSSYNPFPVESQEWWDIEALWQDRFPLYRLREKTKVLHSLDAPERWRLYALRAYNRGQIADAVSFARAAGEAMYRVSPTGPKIRRG